MEWIKLKCDLLRNDKICLLRSEKDGDSLVLLWVGLLCLAGGQDNNGVFRINGQPLTDRMLARLLGATPRLTRRALDLFLYYGMVSQDGDTYYLPGWKDHQTTFSPEDRKTWERDRKRLYRKKQKAVNVPDLSRTRPDKEEDKEKDKEKDSPPIVPLGDGREPLSAGNKTDNEDFFAFWEAYPKKEGRAAAQKAWMGLAPDKPLLQRILADLKARRGGAEWERENGRFIPRAARYLAERRWEDEEAPRPAPDRSYILNEAFERAVARQRAGI